MFNLMFFEPRIAGNSGAAIRLAAITGATLHLVEPLGFDMSEAKLRRAGLDYHDLAHVEVHAGLDTALNTMPSARLLAFTTQATTRFTDFSYEPGDIMMFGPEPTGLPDDIVTHPRVTTRLRIPMRPGLRSLNLANSAAIALYEAWRQHDFLGAQQ